MDIADKSPQYQILAQRCPVSSSGEVSPLDSSLVDRGAVDAELTRICKDRKWWTSGETGMEEKTRMRVITAREASEQVRSFIQSSNQSHGLTPNGQISEIPPVPSTTCAMPSISESPLEQDFTVSGTPSKLGCPFASLANRRLSAHAASVVSRYKPNGTTTPRSSVSRINGRASSVAHASLKDQSGATEVETCARDTSKNGVTDMEASVQGSNGVCPIRFLDDHSPEEVAKYFEEHKHELPRSHEVCVKRYQSNEESIRQLDAKYGNLVNMIQGLGQKHVPLLPGKSEIINPEPDGNTRDTTDRESDERVRRWASNISAPEAVVDLEDGEEQRQPHFDRPVRDVRVGESPSRPWGIQVPLTARRKNSASSSVAAAAPLGSTPGETPAGTGTRDTSLPEVVSEVKQPAGKCPFDLSRELRSGFNAKLSNMEREPHKQPVLLASDPPGRDTSKENTSSQPKMVFTGPVFIGYSQEQTQALLRSMKADE